MTLALTDAQSSPLGYVLTGETDYLELYAAAATAIAAHIGSLTLAARYDPTRTQGLRTILDDIDRRMTELGRTMDLAMAQRPAETRAGRQIWVTAQPLGPMRQTLEQFIEDEDQKLLVDNRGVDAGRHWLAGTIVVALARAMALTCMLCMRTQRDRRVLKAEIWDRTEAVKEARALAERERQRVETLLQDIGHRISNSLATVSSLLGLQLLRSKSDAVRQALEAERSRVHAIASVHRSARLGDDLGVVNADEFIEAWLADMATTLPPLQSYPRP
ncbi:MAG: CHASE3 domain-containing protein [Candidatus Devosia symbiotica]|nr:CHASE3 domain-containing protein [Candidatus Devosia symbiotica]